MNDDEIDNQLGLASGRELLDRVYLPLLRHTLELVKAAIDECEILLEGSERRREVLAGVVALLEVALFATLAGGR
jgi:hypothetical protein